MGDYLGKVHDIHYGNELGHNKTDHALWRWHLICAIILSGFLWEETYRVGLFCDC